MRFAAIAAATLVALPALAQPAPWPERSVKMIVPLGAGGPADLVARYLALQLSEQLKQSFFVENRPGAAGIIGTGEAAKAAPDGYTLLVVASPHINLEVLSHNKPYVLLRDFIAVAPVASTDAVLVVHPAVLAKTVKELITLAKSKPGALTYASSGPGSNKHLGGELFKLMSGTNILHVP
jgi:tripartite-type tricarboxylate transporter receptor subunit TctC